MPPEDSGAHSGSRGPTLALYRSVRGPSFVIGPGPDFPVIAGVLLEMIVALAGIGTAVALYPVVRRQGQARGARSGSAGRVMGRYSGRRDRRN
jgi:hypothetical protein